MSLQKYGPLVARILIAAIFLMSVFGKITGFQGTIGYMSGTMTYLSPTLLTLALILAIIFELVGGLSVLLGYKAKFGALLLIAFTVLATLAFHMNLSDQIQMIMFLKNMGLIGGLILIMVHGSGPFSIDRKKKK